MWNWFKINSKLDEIYETTGNVSPDWIFYNIKELVLIF